MRVPGTGKAGAELFLTIVLGRNRPSRECGVCGTHDSHSVCICTSPVLHSTHRVSNGAKVAHSVTGLPNLDVPPTSQAENCKVEFLTNRGHLVCIHGCSDRPVTHNTSNGEAEPRPRSSCHLGEIVCDNRIAKRGWCGFGGGGGGPWVVSSAIFAGCKGAPVESRPLETSAAPGSWSCDQSFAKQRYSIETLHPLKHRAGAPGSGSTIEKPRHPSPGTTIDV